MSLHPIPDAALDDHVAIVGKTGAGKSYAAKTVIERQLARGERVCVVDPTGVYWGLRLDASGRKASPFDIVILGGLHGDLPLEPGAGAAVAELIATTNTSVVLDVKLFTVGQRTKFFTAFAEALLRRNQGPLNLAIDEVHLFCPQGGGTLGFETTAMLHATNNLVALGRASGLRITMISQRPAKVRKDALTQVETLVAMRVIAPQDQAAVRAWLKGSPEEAKIMGSLARLERGRAWIYAPVHGVLLEADFPRIATFDSGRPLAADEMPGLKPLDVAAVRAAMSRFAASKEGEKVIVSADGKGEKAGRSASAAEIAAAERKGRLAGFEQGFDAGWKACQAKIGDGIGAVLKTVGEPSPDVPGLLASRESEAAPPVARAKPAAAKGEDREPRAAPPAPVADGLTPSLQRVVDAIAWWHAVGHEQVARARAAIVAGYSPKASTFGVYVGDLVKRGLVATDPGAIRLTDTGRKLANAPDMASPREAARGMLKPQETRVLDVVCGSWPEPIRRVDVAKALGLSTTASTIGVYIGAVAAFGMIEAAGLGSVRAADWLFEKKKRGRGMTVHAAAIRFKINPRDVPRAKAARRLGLTEAQFLEKLDSLKARGFPPPDPTTGNYDLQAIDAWQNLRSSLTMGGTTGQPAERIGKKIDDLYSGRPK